MAGSREQGAGGTGDPELADSPCSRRLSAPGSQLPCPQAHASSIMIRFTTCNK